MVAQSYNQARLRLWELRIGLESGLTFAGLQRFLATTQVLAYELKQAELSAFAYLRVTVLSPARQHMEDLPYADLDDHAPAVVLRKDPLGVLKAVRSFLAHG